MRHKAAALIFWMIISTAYPQYVELERKESTRTE